jgi:hypothetical protein
MKPCPPTELRITAHDIRVQSTTPATPNFKPTLAIAVDVKEQYSVSTYLVEQEDCHSKLYDSLMNIVADTDVK